MLITVKNTSQYWIYVLTKNLWKQYQKYQYLHISSFLHYNIKKNDIIFIFYKNKKQNGFVGLCRVEKNQEKNKTNIKIFKDNNQNKFIVYLFDKIIFNKPIILSSVIYAVKYDKPGYRNIKSFTHKFLKQTVGIMNIYYHGFALLKALCKFINIENVQKDTTDLLSIIKISQKSNSKSNYNSDVNPITDIEYQSDLEQLYNYDLNPVSDIESVSDLEQLSDYDLNPVPDIEFETNTHSELKLKTNSSTIKNISCVSIDNLNIRTENKYTDYSEKDLGSGEIPILIVLCNTFKLPKNKNKRNIYFINHYLSCENCEKISNGKKELSSIIKSASINIVVIKKKNDILITIPFDSYIHLKKCEPIDDYKKTPHIQISVIKNNHEIYNNCLLISWISNI